MADLVTRLEHARAAGVTLESAAAFLGDPECVAAAAAGPDAARSAAGSAFAAIEFVVRGAYSRFPAVSGAGFHSGGADPRSQALYSTLTYVRRAGLYTPADLEQMEAAGKVTAAWAAAEYLRLALFVAALEVLVARLDSSAIAPGDYAGAVEELARRFGGLSVAS
jgi:hypothetical protein